MVLSAHSFLIVEVFSPSTKRRDQNQKRDLYLDADVGACWMVDAERRAAIVIRKGSENAVISGEMRWHPAGASKPLVFETEALFGIPESP